MTDLRDDLRRYFDHLADEALAATTIEPARAPARRTHGARWTVVAALLVLGFVAGVALLRHGSDSSRTLRTGPGSAVPLTQAEREAMQAGWARIPGAFPENATVLDVTSGPSGFAAVGYLRETALPTTNGPNRAALWTSTDGRNWTEGPAFGSASRIDSITHWRGEYWVSIAGSMWHSSDLRAWRPEIFVQIDASDAVRPVGLASDDAAGLIVFGGGGALFSDDGVRWNPTNLGNAVYGVTRAGSKWYGLVVGDRTATTIRHLSVYSSEDGRTWRSEVELGETEDPGGAAITTWNGEVWATAYLGGTEHRSTLRRSDGDGEWNLVDADNPRDTSFDTLTPVGRYLVATGFDSDSRPGGWATLDGATWVPMELDQPPGGRLNVAAGNGGSLVALSTSELEDAYRWTAPVAANPPPTQVTTPPASPISRAG